MPTNDQVATAIPQIKLSAQQNVEGMRQIETTAPQLHGLGYTLKSLIERQSTHNDNNISIIMAS